MEGKNDKYKKNLMKFNEKTILDSIQNSSKEEKNAYKEWHAGDETIQKKQRQILVSNEKEGNPVFDSKKINHKDYLGTIYYKGIAIIDIVAEGRQFEFIERKFPLKNIDGAFVFDEVEKIVKTNMGNKTKYDKGLNKINDDIFINFERPIEVIHSGPYRESGRSTSFHTNISLPIKNGNFLKILKFNLDNQEFPMYDFHLRIYDIVDKIFEDYNLKKFDKDNNMQEILYEIINHGLHSKFIRMIKKDIECLVEKFKSVNLRNKLEDRMFLLNKGDYLNRLNHEGWMVLQSEFINFLKKIEKENSKAKEISSLCLNDVYKEIYSKEREVESNKKDFDNKIEKVRKDYLSEESLFGIKFDKQLIDRLLIIWFVENGGYCKRNDKITIGDIFKINKELTDDVMKGVHESAKYPIFKIDNLPATVYELRTNQEREKGPLGETSEERYKNTFKKFTKEVRDNFKINEAREKTESFDMFVKRLEEKQKEEYLKKAKEEEYINNVRNEVEEVSFKKEHFLQKNIYNQENQEPRIGCIDGFHDLIFR